MIMEYTPIFMPHNMITFFADNINSDHLRLWIIRLMNTTAFIHIVDYHLVKNTVKCYDMTAYDDRCSEWDWRGQIDVVMRNTEDYVMMKLQYG